MLQHIHLELNTGPQCHTTLRLQDSWKCPKGGGERAADGPTAAVGLNLPHIFL